MTNGEWRADDFIALGMPGWAECCGGDGCGDKLSPPRFFLTNGIFSVVLSGQKVFWGTVPDTGVSG